MTALELSKSIGLEVVNAGNGNSKQIGGVYCGDLLSVVMSKAKENDAWITVMGNVNSIAVAVLCDVSCIILSEGMNFDVPSLAKAKEQEVCVLRSPLSSFEIAVKIKDTLNL